MRYRTLGASGLHLSAISLGGWINFGEHKVPDEAAIAVIDAARDAGVNFFDLADIYGEGEAERQMGRLLARYPRHELVISSKVFWAMSPDVNDRGLSRKHIMESIDKSLERLGTDYLDLYFCHRADPETPLLETARAMDDLVHRGKILYWGTSEWPAERIDELVALCDRHNLHRPQVEQPEYSMLKREPVDSEIAPSALAAGIGLVVWSPLAQGLLTGKYDDGIPAGSRFARETWAADNWLKPHYMEQVKGLKTVAHDLGISRAQLALAWTLLNPAVTSAIVGATHADQVVDNTAAADITLDAATRRRIEALLSAA